MSRMISARSGLIKPTPKRFYPPLGSQGHTTLNGTTKPAGVSVDGTELIASYNSGQASVRSRTAVCKETGKFAFEGTWQGASGVGSIGITGEQFNETAANNWLGATANSAGFQTNTGRLSIAALHNNSVYTPSNIAGIANGDIIMFLIDTDTGRLGLKWALGGVPNGNFYLPVHANISNGFFEGQLGGGPYWAAVCCDSAGAQWTVNFGATAFINELPGGYSCFPPQPTVI